MPLILVRLLLGATLCLCGPLATGAAASGVYPPQGVQVVQGRVDRNVLPAGERLRLQGGGYQPGTLVRVEAAGRLLEELRADERGAIDVRVRLEQQGGQVVAASGRRQGGGLQVVSATVRVSEAGASSLSDGFARRGDVLPGLLRGLALVVVVAVGTFVLRVLRRPAIPA